LGKIKKTPIFAAQNLSLMANHKATKKDVRQSAKRNERNRYYGKTTRNAIRKLRAIEDKSQADSTLPQVSSMIDKLAQRGTIHKNKAANLKRKLALKVNALGK
jgi:small subunit ribosomal protein S20